MLFQEGIVNPIQGRPAQAVVNDERRISTFRTGHAKRARIGAFFGSLRIVRENSDDRTARRVTNENCDDGGNLCRTVIVRRLCGQRIRSRHHVAPKQVEGIDRRRRSGIVGDDAKAVCAGEKLNGIDPSIAVFGGNPNGDGGGRGIDPATGRLGDSNRGRTVGTKVLAEQITGKGSDKPEGEAPKKRLSIHNDPQSAVDAIE